MQYNVLMSRLGNFCTIHFLDILRPSPWVKLKAGLEGTFEPDSKQFVEVGALDRKLKELQDKFPGEKADKLTQRAIAQVILEN
jgi:hypothetical protein